MPGVVIGISGIQHAVFPPAAVLSPPLRGPIAVGESVFRNLVSVVGYHAPDVSGRTGHAENPAQRYAADDNHTVHIDPLVVVGRTLVDGEIDSVSCKVSGTDFPFPSAGDKGAGLFRGPMIHRERGDDRIVCGEEKALDNGKTAFDYNEFHEAPGEFDNPEKHVYEERLMTHPFSFGNQKLQEKVGKSGEQPDDDVVIECADESDRCGEDIIDALERTQHETPESTAGKPGKEAVVILLPATPGTLQEKLEQIEDITRKGYDRMKP